MQCDDCLALDIPEHLCMEGKSLNVPIDNDELIYRRHKETFEAIGIPTDLSRVDISVLNNLFPLRNDSYNRSKFSEPKDVLINENGIKALTDGILSIPVNIFAVEKKFIANNVEKVCSLNVIFDPKECNYSHCEIQCFVDGVKKEKGDPPASLKLWVRQELLRSMTIISKAS